MAMVGVVTRDVDSNPAQSTLWPLQERRVTGNPDTLLLCSADRTLAPLTHGFALLTRSRVPHGLLVSAQRPPYVRRDASELSLRMTQSIIVYYICFLLYFGLNYLCK